MWCLFRYFKWVPGSQIIFPQEGTQIKVFHSSFLDYFRINANMIANPDNYSNKTRTKRRNMPGQIVPNEFHAWSKYLEFSGELALHLNAI